MKRIALLLALSGCSLAIGDIELSAERPDRAGMDAVVDAAPADGQVDATVADAQVADTQVADAQALDAAWDAQPPPDVSLLDAAVDAAEPDAGPWEVSALAGTWHVYALTGGRRQVQVRNAALQIDPDGTAIITDLGSDAPLSDAATPLGAHPDRPSLVRTNLFPIAGLLIGTIDARSGLGVLVNDVEAGNSQAALVVLVQEKPEPPWPDQVLYTHMRTQPAEQGELGVLVAQGGQHVATRRVQVGESPVALPDRAFNLNREAHGRVAFLPPDDGERVVASPAPEGSGGPGLFEVGGGPVGLTLALRGGGTVAGAQRFFCGGAYFDETAAFVAAGTTGTLRPVDPHPELTFPDGRRLVLTSVGDGFLRIQTPRNFFHRADGGGALDATGRALLMIDGDLAQGTGRWAGALCVALGG